MCTGLFTDYFFPVVAWEASRWPLFYDSHSATFGVYLRVCSHANYVNLRVRIVHMRASVFKIVV